MKRTIQFVVGAVVLLVAWRMIHHSGQIGTGLALGWYTYVCRVFPKVTVRWDGLATWAGAIAALVVVLHFLLRSLTQAARTEATQFARPWRLRWTMAIVAVTLLMFVAGTAMIGVIHQTGWLLRAQEPLFVRKMQQSASHTSNQNLKWAATGNHLYHDHFQRLPTDRLPPEFARHSWITWILPYMGFYAGDLDYQHDWDDPVNAKNFRSFVPPLINPELVTDRIFDERGFGLSHYAGNIHIQGRSESLRTGDITDGLGETILIGEVNANFVPWGKPGNCRDAAEGINTPHGFGGAYASGGAHFAMADATVRFVSADVDPKILRALGTPTGGDNADLK